MSLLLTDRTSIETDWLCGMRYWWYKFEGGTGVVPAKEASYFLGGRIIHHDLSLLAQGMTLDELFEQHLHDDQVPPVGADTELKEQYSRRAGWLTAFYHYRWPAIKARYKVVAVEKEMILDRSPLWVAFTADLVLEDQEDGLLVVDDYKTVGRAGPGWVTHWSTAIQMHIQMIGVEEEMGRKVKLGRIIGLNKGQEKEGKLRHPYVWAYNNGSDDPDGWSLKWKSGWALRPVWERPGSIEQWVLDLGEGIASAQFPQSAPLFPDRRLLNELIARRIEREQEIAAVKEAAKTDLILRRSHFEQRFSVCRPVIGSPCPYLALCHNAGREQNVLGYGDFVQRTPHHDVELTFDEEGDDDEGAE